MEQAAPWAGDAGQPVARKISRIDLCARRVDVRQPTYVIAPDNVGPLGKIARYSRQTRTVTEAG